MLCRFPLGSHRRATATLHEVVDDQHPDSDWELKAHEHHDRDRGFETPECLRRHEESEHRVLDAHLDRDGDALAPVEARQSRKRESKHEGREQQQQSRDNSNLKASLM